MILLPYALLLLVLCTGVVARPGTTVEQRGKKRRPSGEPLEVAATKKPYVAAVSSGSQSDNVITSKLSLEELEKLQTKNKLPSTLWPPKVGGVYYTEPHNFGWPRTYRDRGHNSIHPVIVMGSAARFIDTTADCVLVLEISHNLHVDENYQVDVKSLFPDGTSLSGKVNAGAYRVIEENKFILVPPNPNLHIVTPIETVPEAGLKNLMDRVASASDFPPEQKYYPKWVLANEEDKKKLTRTPNYRPLLSIRAPGRRDLISFLMKEPVA